MVLIQLNVVQEHRDVFECLSTYCEDILVVRYMVVWNALSGVVMASVSCSEEPFDATTPGRL